MDGNSPGVTHLRDASKSRCLAKVEPEADEVALAQVLYRETGGWINCRICKRICKWRDATIEQWIINNQTSCNLTNWRENWLFIA